ncbi:MAG: 4Fe-4S binding protein [Maritimibacter sp.]
MARVAACFWMVFVFLWPIAAEAKPSAPLSDAQAAAFIRAPMALGEKINDQGVWEFLNSGGGSAGYVFETTMLAPIPGFGGDTIRLLVIMDLDGNFVDVLLIDHNEPIFVAGLGTHRLEEYLTQYAGENIATNFAVGVPYGDQSSGAGSLTYLDGVTKATASVRIAHESIMAAARAVAREKMQGLSTEPPAFPDPDVDETLTWNDLVDQGIANRLVVSNSEVQATFEGTIWAGDDPEALANPDQPYIDLWAIDIGPRSIARTVLSDQTYQELQDFLSITPEAEPILLIEAARHGLVTEDFIRNTSPDLITAAQDGLPIALRDADLYLTLAEGVPEGAALILRTDRRLGFDPMRPWSITLEVQRKHGIFQPEVGPVPFTLEGSSPERFFSRGAVTKVDSPFVSALKTRRLDLAIAGVFLGVLMPLLFFGQSWLAGLRHYTPIRLTILAFVIGFVGWWGQGQLSIVTVIGAIRATVTGGGYTFLVYDPFGLLIWVAAILGFLLWGRGLFCGWLCPFGAMQEFAHHLGRVFRLPEFRVPDLWDHRLKGLKYVFLAGLVALYFLAPDHVDKAMEIEPFKTAITTFFIREWYYVAYAVFWLVLSMVLYKGFCRYVCPLGAFMALGGLLRGRKWIERRSECGAPCQLCKVKCNYNAIKKTGEIEYSECFGCLDCVTIFDDPKKCVPLIVAAKKQGAA